MNDVYVYVYDISKGLASQLSLPLIGKRLDGVWHTGIYAYEMETYFGSGGIESKSPEMTILGAPNQKIFIGKTSKTETEFKNHLKMLSNGIFSGHKYELLYHNCNSFSNELSLWLTGKGIPDYITNLPIEVMNTPFGQLIRPYIEQFSPAVSVAYQAIASQSNAATAEMDVISVRLYEDDIRYEFEISDVSCIKASSCNVECLKKLMKNLRNNGPLPFSRDIIDLLESTQADVADSMKVAIFDVLRLLTIKCDELTRYLFNSYSEWIDLMLIRSDISTVDESKYKFFLNFLGKIIDYDKACQLPLDLIAQSTVEEMRNTDSKNILSSIIRNILLVSPNIDVDILIEISCYFIHTISNDFTSFDEYTKENIIASVYLMVKSSIVIKDIAKAQDLQKRVRRETIYCQMLFKELQ